MAHQTAVYYAQQGTSRNVCAGSQQVGVLPITQCMVVDTHRLARFPTLDHLWVAGSWLGRLYSGSVMLALHVARQLGLSCFWITTIHDERQLTQQLVGCTSNLW